VAFSDGAHQEKAKAGAANLPEGAAGHTIKTLEDGFQLGARNADTAVLHPQNQPLLLFYRELDGYINVVARILHRIVENVRHRSAQIFGITTDLRTTAVQRRLITKRAGLEMMAGAGALHAFFNQLGKIQVDVLPLPAGHPCLQYLLDSAHQAVGVFEHEPVEVAALRVIDVGLAALKGLQVKADGGDGRFQFVSNGIDKAIVLFVAANFTNEKTGVEYQTGSDGTKKDDPEKNFDIMLPVQDDPAETDSDRD